MNRVQSGHNRAEYPFLSHCLEKENVCALCQHWPLLNGLPPKKEVSLFHETITDLSLTIGL